MTEIINVVIALSIVMVLKDCYESFKTYLHHKCSISESKSRYQRIVSLFSRCLNANKEEKGEKYFKESAVSIEEFDSSES